jgi:hypothetical protein
MPYYMRFFMTDEDDLSLAMLESGLKDKDAAYAITEKAPIPLGEAGQLMFEQNLYGIVEINQPVEGEELEEFLEDLEDVRGEKKRIVLQVLENARAVVVVQVLSQGRETEATLEKLDPLWEWLFVHRQGLLHADGEGYYDQAGLVLEVD